MYKIKELLSIFVSVSILIIFLIFINLKIEYTYLLSSFILFFLGFFAQIREEQVKLVIKNSNNSILLNVSKNFIISIFSLTIALILPVYFFSISLNYKLISLLIVLIVPAIAIIVYVIQKIYFKLRKNDNSNNEELYRQNILKVKRGFFVIKALSAISFVLVTDYINHEYSKYGLEDITIPNSFINHHIIDFFNNFNSISLFMKIPILDKVIFLVLSVFLVYFWRC